MDFFIYYFFVAKVQLSNWQSRLGIIINLVHQFRTCWASDLNNTRRGQLVFICKFYSILVTFAYMDGIYILVNKFIRIST